jgi:hypothetical protein
VGLQSSYASSMLEFFAYPPNMVVSLNFRDEVLSAAYHQIRASQGTKVPLTV